jgi:hypothetical protein
VLDKSAFVQNYSRVMAMSWADDEYKDRLLQEPRQVLAEAGIAVPQNAQVNVITVASEEHGKGKIEDQIIMWEKGELTGTFDLLVPLKPVGWTPENVALTDEQLAAVAGGAEAMISISCCCCTPCCCCT